MTFSCLLLSWTTLSFLITFLSSSSFSVVLRDIRFEEPIESRPIPASNFRRKASARSINRPVSIRKRAGSNSTTPQSTDNSHANAPVQRRLVNVPLKLVSPPEDTSPYVEISIDGSEDLLPVILDTGSDTLAVPGIHCPDSAGCIGKKYLETGRNVGNHREILFGTGSVDETKMTGSTWISTVLLGDLVVQGQRLMSIEECEHCDTVDDGQNTAGSLGLSVNNMEDSASASLMQNLQDQKLLLAPEMSFFFGRQDSPTEGQDQLTIGGRDYRKAGPSFTSIPLEANDHDEWIVALDNIRIYSSTQPSDGSIAWSTKGYALIDTGTPGILLSLDLARKVFYNIPDPLIFESLLKNNMQPSGEYLTAFKCDGKPPSVSFVLNGKEFHVHDLDFNRGELQIGNDDIVYLDDDEDLSFRMKDDDLKNLKDSLNKGDKYCLSVIYAKDTPNLSKKGEPYILLGTAFMRNWYTVFQYGDSPQVHLAAAAGNNPEAEDGKENDDPRRGSGRAIGTGTIETKVDKTT